MGWEGLLRRIGLWPRLALGLSAGLLALFLAFAVLGERAVRESATRLLEERELLTEMAAEELDDFFLQAGEELARLSRRTPFEETGEQSPAAWLTTLYHQRPPWLLTLLLLDAEGRLQAAYPPEESLPVGNQGLPLNPKPEGLTFSPPFRHPKIGTPVMLLMVPIQSVRGQQQGFLGGLLDLEDPHIQRVLQRSVRLGQAGHALLVDPYGNVVISTLPLPFGSPGEHARFYREAFREGRARVGIVPVESGLSDELPGHLHIMAFVPLRTAPLALAMGGDLEPVMVPLNRLRLGLALLSLLALGGIWGASLLGAHLLVRPVRRLTAAAQRIADGDLSTPLRVSEGGEIGAMAEALERMRLRLLKNIQELTHWSETLELRVAERTEALRQQEALTRQLLRRLLTVQEEERARLARELHDEAGQILTAVQLNLNRLAKALGGENPGAQEQIERAQELIAQAMEDLRRVIRALRPMALDQLGLIPALRGVAETLLQPQGISLSIKTEGISERLPREVELILFRIAQEAMHNVVRHSQATQVWIHLMRRESELVMEVQDNGRGFDLSAIIESGAERGLGLAGMRERASLVGGQLEIQTRPGQGTTIRVRIPWRFLEKAASESAGDLPPPE
jgi:signal transduction histidine kinase